MVLGPRALPLLSQQQQNFPESALLLFYMLMWENLCGEDDDGGQKVQLGIPAQRCH